MIITQKLTKQITEVSYLRAENAERYRIIIRFFYEEHEKINYWLHKEDVYQMMMDTSLFPEYTIEMCQNDLTSLSEWGNLIAMQDSSKVLTIDEFKNRKFRYQLSDYTIVIERMAITLEHLESENASLEPTLLERIHRQVLRLPEMVHASDQETSSWWNDLNNDFIRLNRNYQDYIRTLNSAKAEEMMKTKEFLVFKDKIISYLRSFVKGLQEQALILEDYIKKISDDTVELLVKKVITYEMSIPRIDHVVDETELYETFMGRWNSLYNWFVGDHGISEVSRMSDVTSDIIRRITRYAQQIGEMHNRGANKSEEYRHLAGIFGKCKTIDEAHRMSAMVFGVHSPFHFRALSDRDTESIDSGVYNESITYYPLEPRTRIAVTRSKRKPAVDYQLEMMMQKEELLRQQEENQKQLGVFVENGVIDFAHIDILTSYNRKILLGWLSRGLSSVTHRGRTEWGDYYTIDDSNQTICKICCEDGDFFMPAFRICFEKKEGML